MLLQATASSLSALSLAALAASSLMPGVSVLKCTHQTETTDVCLQVAKKAVTAAGYLCRGERDQGILTLHIDALLETAKVKSDVLPFAAGESLCFAFGGAALRLLLSYDQAAKENALLHDACVISNGSLQAHSEQHRHEASGN